MVGKRRANEKRLKELQRVKTWQLLLIFVLLCFIAATFLRLNNIGMVQRRDAVMSADEQGNTDVLRDRLYELQRYSSSRMNADTGQFYLENTYYRDAETARERTQNQGGVAENIYAQIDEEICGPLARDNNWRWPDVRYTNCIREQLEQHPEAEGFALEADVPDSNLYRHSFASPMWSPDFAGFSVLASILLFLMIIARCIGIIILRILVRRHYKHT